MKRAIFVLILCILSVAAKAQESAEVVNFAGPEKYPAAARAVRARGEVVVMVQVSPSGEVVSATAVSGHPLLRGASEQAALKWRFSEAFAATANAADVKLSFNYQSGETKSIKESEKASESAIRNVHPSPFRIEVFDDILVPKLLLLPREFGEIKAEVCEIHNHPMQMEVIEKSKGSFLPEQTLENFYEAQEEFFPNANLAAYVRFDDGIERREIHFCHICRVKREEWFKENL